MDECIHGQTTVTCSICIRGTEVPGWSKGGKKRRYIPPRPVERKSWTHGMLGVDPKYTAANPRCQSGERELAPSWRDSKFAVRGRAKGDEKSPVPYPRMGGAVGKRLRVGAVQPRVPGR